MSAHPAPPEAPGRWTAGRIVLVVLGSIAALIGAGLLVAGIGALWADQTQRDDGYLSTPTETFATSSHAILSERIDLVEADNAAAEWVFSDDFLGDVRLQAAAGEDVFVGIARTRDVEAYLSGAAYDTVREIDYEPFRVAYDRVPGTGAPAPPAEQDFWVASSGGGGTQAVTWDVESGAWSLVVMNADGAAGVTADVSVGVEANFLTWLAVILLVTGIVFLAGGGGMIYGGARRAGGAAASDPAAVRAAGIAPGVYPVAVAGELQPGLSRWLWLVKWLLAIPHYVVLAFLWIAYTVLTLVAGIAILFTGRYPRGIFSFNLGVLRWTWRVWFYSYWANGTDRYPPFSLGEEPDYPARLDIAYPERLTRWMPLVKWLLAIPHLILVGIFVGGWGWGLGGDWAGMGFAGLVGLLVVIAGFVLLFTGRYPPALFDFALGLDRWALRVAAYVGLMTDQYPPFRLDMGPHEPAASENVPPDRAPAAA